MLPMKEACTHVLNPGLEMILGFYAPEHCVQSHPENNILIFHLNLMLFTKSEDATPNTSFTNSHNQSNGTVFHPLFISGKRLGEFLMRQLSQSWICMRCIFGWGGGQSWYFWALKSLLLYPWTSRKYFFFTFNKTTSSLPLLCLVWLFVWDTENLGRNSSETSSSSNKRNTEEVFLAKLTW